LEWWAAGVWERGVGGAGGDADGVAVVDGGLEGVGLGLGDGGGGGLGGGFGDGGRRDGYGGEGESIYAGGFGWVTPGLGVAEGGEGER